MYIKCHGFWQVGWFWMSVSISYLYSPHFPSKISFFLFCRGKRLIDRSLALIITQLGVKFHDAEVFDFYSTSFNYYLFLAPKIHV